MVRLITFLLCAPSICALYAQDAERAIRKGNQAYEKGDAPGAVRAYEQAAKDERAMFNLGNAWYGQDSMARAQQAFENAAAMAKGGQAQARAYYNLGNAHLTQRKYQEAVNAYKETLKRVPNDEDARYNLALAQKMLERQQQQQNKDKDKGKDKDKQQGQENKQEQAKEEQGQRPQEEQAGKKDGKEDQEQKPLDRIDPKDAQRMLDAAQQQEKNVQDEVRRKLQPKPETPTDKDW